MVKMVNASVASGVRKQGRPALKAPKAVAEKHTLRWSAIAKTILVAAG